MSVHETGVVVQDGPIIATLWHGMPTEQDQAALERVLQSIDPAAPCAALIVAMGSLAVPNESQRSVMRALRESATTRNVSLFGAFLSRGIVAALLRAMLPRDGALRFPDGSGRVLHVHTSRESGLAAMEAAGFGSERIRSAVLAWSTRPGKGTPASR